MLDILFIHPPKFRNYYQLLGNYMSITKMPAGLLSLADIADNNDFKTQVIHLGVEFICNTKFSLKDYLLEHKPKIICISLHFHHQSFDAIKTVKVVRNTLKKSFILLGGYTASFFCMEIMNKYTEVDAIIKGDAELPLSNLLKSFSKNNFTFIPNLIWRKKETVIANEQTYICSHNDFNKFSRVRLSLLKNHDVYIKIVQHLFFYKHSFSLKQNLKFFGGPEGFPLPLVRGCNYLCTYCGGNKNAQKIINNRTSLTILSVDKTIREIQLLYQQGVNIIFIEYVKVDVDDLYYLDIFNKINEKQLNINLNVECRTIPSDNFLIKFKETFKDIKRSRLVFSLDSISEKNRSEIKRGIDLSESKMYNKFSKINSLHINFEVYFTIGLPTQHQDKISNINKMIIKLRKKYKYLQAIRIHTVELDPASTYFCFPKKHNIVTNLKSFNDYYIYHKEGHSMFNSLGYTIKNNGKQQSIDEHSRRSLCLICSNFCRLTMQYSWKYPFSIRKFINLIIRIFCLSKNIFFKKSSSFKDYFPY